MKWRSKILKWVLNLSYIPLILLGVSVIGTIAVIITDYKFSPSLDGVILFVDLIGENIDLYTAFAIFLAGVVAFHNLNLYTESEIRREKVTAMNILMPIAERNLENYRNLNVFFYDYWQLSIYKDFTYKADPYYQMNNATDIQNFYSKFPKSFSHNLELSHNYRDGEDSSSFSAFKLLQFYFELIFDISDPENFQKHFIFSYQKNLLNDIFLASNLHLLIDHIDEMIDSFEASIDMETDVICYLFSKHLVKPNGPGELYITVWEPVPAANNKLTYGRFALEAKRKFFLAYPHLEQIHGTINRWRNDKNIIIQKYLTRDVSKKQKSKEGVGKVSETK